MVISVAMLTSMGSTVMAEGVESDEEIIFDISSYEMTVAEHEFFDGLIEFSKTADKLRGYVTLSVPYYQQTDSRWSDETMQNAGLDIGTYGCALTSFAMVMNYYGSTDNPKVVNQKLGTDACDSTNGINWWGAGGKYGKTVNVSKGYTQSDFLSIIKGAVFSYRPAIIGMRSGAKTHFVVANSYIEEVNYPAIVNINDPGYSRKYQLSEYLNNGWSMESVVVY